MAQSDEGRKIRSCGYSARLTGNPFLYNEFKLVCELIDLGLNQEEAISKIAGENLFSYRSSKSVNKRFKAVWERVCYLNDHLRGMVLKQSNEIGRIINLYAVLKYDLLLLEWMEQVLSEKLCINQPELARSDISSFFTAKAEQSEIVAGFKESTLKRLRSSYFEILQGAGYLRKIKNKMELNVPIAAYAIADYLESISQKRYARAMLGK